MTKKMMKIFLLVLAFAMIVFISAAAYAEEAAPVINEEDLVDLKRAANASLKPITEGLSLYHKYYRSLWW